MRAAQWFPALALRILRHLELGKPDPENVLRGGWSSYRGLCTSIPRHATVGAGVMVCLAALTVGVYQALFVTRRGPAEAQECAARINWAVCLLLDRESGVLPRSSDSSLRQPSVLRLALLELADRGASPWTGP